MKQVKWNKKRKWANTRYCKPFKARLAFRRVDAAMIANSASFHLSAIAAQTVSTKEESLSKAVAISSLTVDTLKRSSDELAKGGER